MPKYLIQASYTSDGLKGVQSGGGSARRDAVVKLVESVGGKLEALYFAFGDADLYAIAELDGNEAAAAIALTVNTSGAVTTKTTVLLSPEEVDAAAKLSVDYRPPGS